MNTVHTVHTVHLHDVADQPWRNGGGTTRELLAWPAGGEWVLRVSVATIARDGPFSAFAGVARCFAVLSGAGVVLTLPDGPRRLAPGDEPVAFDGAAAPGCRLMAGPTQDLNLMARSDAGTAAMRGARPGDTLAAPLRWRGLYSAAAARLLHGERAFELPADTLAWTDETAAPPWMLQAAAGPAWWLTLDAPEDR